MSPGILTALALLVSNLVMMMLCACSAEHVLHVDDAYARA